MADFTFGDGIYWVRGIDGSNVLWGSSNSVSGFGGNLVKPSLSGTTYSYSGTSKCVLTNSAYAVADDNLGLQYYSLGNQKYLSTQIDGLSAKIDNISTADYTGAFQGVNDKLDSVISALGSGVGSGVDYSQPIAKLSQLLVWCDLLLVVLIALLVVFAGVYVGSLVTRWLRTR